MDTMSPADDERLGCGRALDRVWEGLGHPPDEHERSCRDCQAARARLMPLFRATAQQLSQEDDDDGLVPRSEVRQTILQAARAEIRRTRRLPLTQPAENARLYVSDLAVTATVRRTADEMTDVHAGRVQVTAVAPAAGPGDAAEVAIAVTVRTAVGRPLPTLVGELRTRIIDNVRRRIGLRVRRIDVAVEDLYDV